MSNGIKVKKRNGRGTEALDLEKMHKMVEEATKGVAGVSASQVEIQSGIQFYDGITTDEIQEILIKSASDLIDLDHPNYQFVAARLLLFAIRKQIYGKMRDLPHLETHIMSCTNQDVYDKAEDVIDCYSKKMKLLGEAGSGQLAKMTNQICIAGLVQGLSEAINFGMNAGLDMEDVVEVISKGAAQSWQMENRHKTMIEDEFNYGFAVDWMRKDLKIAIEESEKNNSELPVTKIVDQFYSEVQDMGGGRWDTSSLIKRFRK